MYYKGPSNGNADGLSRMPSGDDAANEVAAEEGGRSVKDCMGNSPSGAQWPEYPEYRC